MHIAFIVTSALLALEMAGAGVPKLLQLSAVRKNAEHLGTLRKGRPSATSWVSSRPQRGRCCIAKTPFPR